MPPPGMARPSRGRLLAWGLPAWAIAITVIVMAIRHQPGTFLIGLAIGASAIAVAAAVVSAWVAHNRSLARRREAERGGRRGAPDRPLVITSDARGRTVRISPGAREARVVIARVEGDEKILTPEAAR